MVKLGLDLGAKSLGVAVSDPTNKIAFAKENYFFPLHNLSHALKKVAFYLKNYDVDTIVLGIPQFPSGNLPSTGKLVQHFAKVLKENFSQKIVLFPEQNTTKLAISTMVSQNLSRKKQKQKKDSLSAQIILQSFLDSCRLL